MAADAATVGFFVGGSLGAAVAYLMARKRPTGDEDDDPTPGTGALDIAGYRHINADGALGAALTGPIALFASLDRREALGLLQNFEDIAEALARCRGGDATASLVAQALAARRLATGRIAMFTRRARQERPVTANDQAEEIEALKKFLADYLYNIHQEQGLRRLTRGGG